MRIVFYEENGRVGQVQSGLQGREIENLLARGLPILRVADGQSLHDHYVVEDSDGRPHLIERPIAEVAISKTRFAANDQDEVVVTICGIPGEFPLMIDGVAYVVADGEARITSPMPATYEIAIDHWPFMPWSTMIVAE